MANDIDMWNDLKTLEKTKHKSKARHLHKVYSKWFIEDDMQATKEAIEEAEKEFPDFPFDFSGYGISIMR